MSFIFCEVYNGTLNNLLFINFGVHKLNKVKFCISDNGDLVFWIFWHLVMQAPTAVETSFIFLKLTLTGSFDDRQ